MDRPTSVWRLVNLTIMGEDFCEEELSSIEDMIKYHQHEMERMKRRMEVAKGEHEFAEAESYQIEFWRHESKLRFLRVLKDPMFDRRASLYDRLIRTEDMIRENPHIPHLITQCRLTIKAINKELDEIESVKSIPLDTQYIDAALFELVEGSILDFRIYLNKEHGIFLDFTCEGKSLFIHFRYSKGSMGKYAKKGLQRLGFSKSEEKRVFLKEFDVSGFRDAQPVKQLLAVALFDVLGRGRFDKLTELIINRRPELDSPDSVAD